jgi:hypothetical protein
MIDIISSFGGSAVFSSLHLAIDVFFIDIVVEVPGRGVNKERVSPLLQFSSPPLSFFSSPPLGESERSGGTELSAPVTGRLSPV